MEHSRSFKIVAHLSEALILEEEEFHFYNSKFMKEFEDDFQHEISFLNSSHKNKEEMNIEPTPSLKEEKLFKRLHRKLAMVTHPDRSPGSEEDFKKVQTAYETGDYATLISESLKRDIDVKASTDEVNAVLNHINKRRKKLEEKKQTLHWLWCNSNKSESDRSHAHEVMQIDNQNFQVWKNKSTN